MPELSALNSSFYMCHTILRRSSCSPDTGTKRNLPTLSATKGFSPLASAPQHQASGGHCSISPSEFSKSKRNNQQRAGRKQTVNTRKVIMCLSSSGWKLAAPLHGGEDGSARQQQWLSADISSHHEDASPSAAPMCAGEGLPPVPACCCSEKPVDMDTDGLDLDGCNFP